MQLKSCELDGSAGCVQAVRIQRGLPPTLSDELAGEEHFSLREDYMPAFSRCRPVVAACDVFVLTEYIDSVRASEGERAYV